jgi:hypothetical protein
MRLIELELLKRKIRQIEKIYRKEMPNKIINSLTLDCILGIKQDQQLNISRINNVQLCE